MRRFWLLFSRDGEGYAITRVSCTEHAVFVHVERHYPKRSEKFILAVDRNFNVTMHPAPQPQKAMLCLAA